MSKKKKKQNDVSEDTCKALDYNAYQDDNIIDDAIPEGDTCKCGGYLWRIDDYIICGHCGRKWYPEAILKDD